MYYVGTEQECINYNNKVVDLENYQEGTTAWASITKHYQEELWAIEKHEEYEPDDVMELVSSIDDWFEPFEF